MEGREPAEVTEHEYEGGRLVRSVTVREPEWTEQDLLEVLALAEYRDSLCDCCGLPKSQVWVHERDAPPFVVSKWLCLARRTLNETQAHLFSDKPPTPSQQALLWSVRAKKG